MKLEEKVTPEGIDVARKSAGDLPDKLDGLPDDVKGKIRSVAYHLGEAMKNMPPEQHALPIGEAYDKYRKYGGSS